MILKLRKRYNMTQKHYNRYTVIWHHPKEYLNETDEIQKSGNFYENGQGYVNMRSALKKLVRLRKTEKWAQMYDCHMDAIAGFGWRDEKEWFNTQRFDYVLGTSWRDLVDFEFEDYNFNENYSQWDHEEMFNKTVIENRNRGII